MTLRVEKNKWILYRHTRDFYLICTVAEYLKKYTKASITNEDKLKLIIKLKELGLYNERNPQIPLDSINHRINTLAYYMFGYKDKINGKERFLFSPLGNLFLKYINNENARTKIFFTMLWSLQFEHPHSGTDKSFNLYPFRLIFKLLTDDRLERKLYAYEVASTIVFTKNINNELYEELVKSILKMRSLSNDAIEKKFREDEHAYVNSSYEWDYYVSELFQSAGILKKIEGEVICRLRHGQTNTYRKITRNVVYLTKDVYKFCIKLLKRYSYEALPLKLDDPERLKIDIIKEIYSFYPEILLKEIGEDNKDSEDILKLPKLIEQYSNNVEGSDANYFEKILVDGFNMFYNVEAKKIGGAGETDIECLYLTKKKKFAVDAKSTKNKLSYLNAGRLENHRNKIGAVYTIVITPRYVPAVKHDIKSANIVIILASTFSEFLYNCIINNLRKIDYADFDDIIIDNLGLDISSNISNLTITKFGISNDLNG